MPEATLDDVHSILEDELPADARVSEVAFEGPELVIYTEAPEIFAERTDLVPRLARELKKRITVRATGEARASPKDARKRIEEIVPDDAGVRNVEFYPGAGEVLVEAEKPGLVVGRRGATLREVTTETGWSVDVLRTPPIESNTISNIRHFLKHERADRREFLERVGDSIYRDAEAPERVRVSTLGCCREVGRACFLLSTNNSRVLVDCGDKPGADGEVPYLNAVEAMPLTDIDAVVLTHAHLDHSALIPILFKYGYDGPIYTTAPTRDLMGLLQLDYLNVASKEGRSPPYESEMVRQAIKHTITVEYGAVTDVTPDIKLTLRNAGHILGSASAHFHVGSGFHNIVFSGDIHYTDTRLFNGVDNDYPRVETLVMESTYGRQQDHQTDQSDAERHLKDIIAETVERGGLVLIPSFAVGRSQELMLVLEEAMREDDLPTLPIYLDGMIREATAIHAAYPGYLRDGLRERILHDDENPFLAEQFQQVDGGQEMREEIATGGPAVILSTSGMMEGGPIMSWLELVGPDPDSALAFVGYQAAGTLGNTIQQGRREITLHGRNGRAEHLYLDLQVESVTGFSGHADRSGLVDFVQTMGSRPERILCVHGDESATNQLSSALYDEFNTRTFQPKNLETFRLD